MVTASSKWERRQEEARLVEGRTMSCLWDTWSWKYMDLRCREQREVTTHPPRDTEVDQSYGNGWNHPRKAHREREEERHPSSSLLQSRKERDREDLERRQWRGWEIISGLRELDVSTG